MIVLIVEVSSESQDVIIVDINTSNTDAAITCPPQPFLEHDFLQDVQRALKSKGQLKVVANVPV